MFNSNFLSKMTKSRFQLRNMAKIGVACLAVLMFVACSKKDKNGGGESGKLSPPAWVQGSWRAAPGGLGPEVYNLTSDDVLMSGVSLKTYAVSGPGSSVTISETKKTDNQYDITIKVKAGSSESISGFWSFKKGDGTYIEYGTDLTGTTNVEYTKLYKR